LNAGGRP